MAILANAGMGQGNYRTILWCAVSGDDLSGYKEFLQLIGNPPTLNLADVELPVREALPKADAEARRDVYRVCDSRRPKTVEVLTYDEIEDLMANDEFMYIHTFRSTPAEKYGKSWDTLDRIADMLEIDDTDKVKVILVTKTNYRLFKSRLKGKQDYVEYLMEGLKSKFDLKRHCELSSIVDEHFVRWRKHELVELSEDFVTFAGGDLADPASYTCKIEEPFIKETLTFFDAVDHMDTQLDESKKILDALMLHLPMNEKEALRLRIETTQAGMKPKIKVSDLDDRLKTIFRHYKWLAFHYAKSIDQPNYEDEWVAMMNKAIALDPLK